MMFWPNYDMGGWGYAGMAIGMVLFWFVIIGSIVAIVRFNARPSRIRTVPRPQPNRESPEQLMAIRFAHGEIDESEYQQRLAVLREATRH